MTLRIAMVGACPFPVPQGSQVLLADTARQAASQGHEVHLVVYGYGAGEAPADLTVHRCADIPGQGKTQAGPSFAKPFLDTVLTAKLRRIIREYNIDIVHAHNYEGLVAALAAMKRPIVYHAHNALADELPHYFGAQNAAQRFGAWFDRALPHRADHCIVPHERLAEYLVRHGCNAERVSVIPPAVDTSNFVDGGETSAEPHVLYTGNLDRYQNLELLTQAMEQVRSVLPETRLVIATSDDRPFPCDERIDTTGFDALRLALANDAVVACPRVSWSGYPVKLLNAMAAGRAIVACKSAAHSLQHGETGLIVPDNDATEFADALIDLLQHPEKRRQLGQNARDYVTKHHKPETIARQLNKVYETIRP